MRLVSEITGVTLARNSPLKLLGYPNIVYEAKKTVK